MTGLPSPLRTELPVLAAPMAGGPGTTELVVAAAEAGSLGFVAAGYLDAAGMAQAIAAVRARTTTFGVNLFAPPLVRVDPAEYDRYRARLASLARRLDVELPPAAIEDDDDWEAKLEVLLADPVPIVTFTFGIPSSREIAALRAAGTVTVQTITNGAEAASAKYHGVDALVAQGGEAGGHYGTLSPVTAERLSLPDVLASSCGLGLPVIAAGGVATAGDVRAALEAGAFSVCVGTALLLSDEAGTSEAHRIALGQERETIVTRAFTGRPARGLSNVFIREHEEAAPLGYPAIHHLTRPIRRAAAAAVVPEYVNLWAGTGYRHARTGPAADILRGLAEL